MKLTKSVWDLMPVPPVCRAKNTSSVGAAGCGEQWQQVTNGQRGAGRDGAGQSSIMYLVKSSTSGGTMAGDGWSLFPTPNKQQHHPPANNK